MATITGYTKDQTDTLLDGKADTASLSSTYVAPTGTDGRLQVAGVDVTPRQVGAAPALGADDNYVTDAEKLALHSHVNKTALDAVSGTNTGDEPDASTSVKGIVELATTTETTTGTDTTRATTPAGVKAALDAKAASDMSTYAAYDVTSPGTADDKARIIAAATAAAAAGRDVLRIAPGAYVATGLTVSDISNLYVVGDGVTLTGAWVYPFTTQEWVSQSATRTIGRGGRGVVAFEVDDALPEHWTLLFPLTKRLGITIGSSWHFNNGAQWITEAHRHGWEIMSHMSENMDATALTTAQLEAEAEAGLAAIEAATGSRENIGFVYPQHLRNTTTDRILSKYYSRGRGLSSRHIYPNDQTRTWLTTATYIDEWLVTPLPEAAKELLRNVAKTDGRLVMYFHTSNVDFATKGPALVELVEFIRGLGIEIVNPSQVWGSTDYSPDPYDEKGQWVVSGPVVKSTEAVYHGDHSFKITPDGSANATGTITGPSMILKPTPGLFTVLRVSFRYMTTADVSVTGPAQGIGFQIVESLRALDGTFPTGGYKGTGARLPTFPATVIPSTAGEWVRYSQLVHVHPGVQRITPRLAFQNILATAPPIFIDELKFELIDYVSAVNYRATLAGTANVYVYTAVPDVAAKTLIVTPLAPMTGKLTVTTSDNLIMIKSDTAGDTAPVNLTILPGASWSSMTLPETGA